MRVITPPSEPWLDMSFRCGTCGALVELDSHDRRDSAFRARFQQFTQVWEVRSRCPHCISVANFTQEQERDGG